MAIQKGQKLIPVEKQKRNLIAVRLTDSELAALNAIAEREDLPLSYLVRRGVALILKEYQKRK